MKKEIQEVYDFLSGRSFLLDTMRDDAKTDKELNQLDGQIKELNRITTYLKDVYAPIPEPEIIEHVFSGKWFDQILLGVN